MFESPDIFTSIPSLVILRDRVLCGPKDLWIRRQWRYDDRFIIHSYFLYNVSHAATDHYRKHKRSVCDSFRDAGRVGHRPGNTDCSYARRIADCAGACIGETGGQYARAFFRQTFPFRSAEARAATEQGSLVNSDGHLRSGFQCDPALCR